MELETIVGIVLGLVVVGFIGYKVFGPGKPKGGNPGDGDGGRPRIRK